MHTSEIYTPQQLLVAAPVRLLIFAFLFVFAALNANASSSLVSGAVENIYGVGCEYQTATAGAGSCGYSEHLQLDTNPSGGDAGGLTILGDSSSSVDSHGVHAASTIYLGMYGDVVPNGSVNEFVVSASASASFTDGIDFAPMPQTSGYMTMTLTADGSLSADSSSTEQLIANQEFCYVYGYGSCSVTQLVDFTRPTSLGMSVVCQVQAQVGIYSAQESVCNDSNTAYLSQLSFTDLNGNPLQVSYTTESGYSYPMVPVPEPAISTLFALGCLAFAVVSLPRRRLLSRNS